MTTSIEINGRSVALDISKTASQALTQRSTPLLAEMELYFSCLIRKKVRFRDAEIEKNVEEDSAASTNSKNIAVDKHLHVGFRPVMTRVCGKDYEGDEPPLTDFPIVNARAYVPRWLRIDYVRGQWQGEFGYEKD